MIGNICFMLERKSFSDAQSSEVFDDILFDYKTEILVLSYSTLNVKPIETHYIVTVLIECQISHQPAIIFL